MTSSLRQYLTQSRHGIWLYQRSIPLRFQRSNTNLKPLFKVSLRTRELSSASRISRAISVKIDQLILDHFDNPESFAKAMEQLYSHLKAETTSSSFEDYENTYLSQLDEADEFFLSKGSRLVERFNQQIEDLNKQIALLKEALLNSNNGNGFDIDKIIEKLNPKLADEDNPTLNELVDEWTANKAQIMQKRSFEDTYLPAIEFFVRVVQDYEGKTIRINDLSLNAIKHYQAVYKKIPLRTNTKDVPIESLVHKEGKSKSPSTISQNFTNIGTFLNWINTKGYPIQDRAIGVLTKGGDVRVTAQSMKQRQPQTDKHISALFNSDQYKTGNFRTSAQFWVPLIALYSGARMTEILQLEKSDIKKEKGIWVIDIDDINPNSKDEHKHVKKDGSRRIVPIHSKLIELGNV